MITLSSVLFLRAVLARATKTISYPGAKCGSLSAAALITLLARLRCTALPIFLLVVIPIRQIPARFFIT